MTENITVHARKEKKIKLKWGLKNTGTSLAGQWLRYCTPNAGGMGSIPGQGIKILYAAGTAPPQKKGKKKIYIYTHTHIYLFIYVAA